MWVGVGGIFQTIVSILMMGLLGKCSSGTPPRVHAVSGN